ncbi:type II toxin-antitoxin system VapC family toxin [archaeon]|nr:type II toxin-antitoxin system VapC family toxin [archaeon]
MRVFDSSALIDLLDQTPRGKKIEKILGYDLVRVTHITVHEILVGAKNNLEKELLKALLKNFVLLDFGFKEAEISAELEIGLNKENKKMNDADLFIASICISNEASLVTCDADFKKIKGLDLVFI